MHGESEVIAEGQSYRVVLDPPDDDPATKPDEDHPSRRPSHRRRGFLFFLVGAALAPVIHNLLREPIPPLDVSCKTITGPISKMVCHRESDQRRQFFCCGAR